MKTVEFIFVVVVMILAAVIGGLISELLELDGYKRTMVLAFIVLTVTLSAVWMKDKGDNRK
jgi:hypothetical protein